MSIALGIKRNTNKQVDLSDDNTLEKVIQEYGNTLERHAVLAGRFINELFLPYPKKVIQDAIELAVRVAPDNPMNEMLKAAHYKTSFYKHGLSVDMVEFGSSEYNSIANGHLIEVREILNVFK